MEKGTLLLLVLLLLGGGGGGGGTGGNVTKNFETLGRGDMKYYLVFLLLLLFEDVLFGFVFFLGGCRGASRAATSKAYSLRYEIRHFFFKSFSFGFQVE